MIHSPPERISSLLPFGVFYHVLEVSLVKGLREVAR